MPSTLVHMGVQGFATRFVWARVELLWIFMGIVIPDLGWITQRVAKHLPLDISRYDLLGYATVQSSFAVCLIVCAAIAVLTSRPARVFLILALSVLFHLLIDASEVKWANGVLLFAPFFWKFTSWNLFLQDGILSIVLTMASFVYLVKIWKTGIGEVSRSLFQITRRSVIACLVLLAMYLSAPLLMINKPHEANLYDLATLQGVETRSGKSVTLDRVYFDAENSSVKIYTGETIRVLDLEVKDRSLVSLRGTFVSPMVLQVDESLIHHPWLRDTFAKVGLLAFFLFVAHAAFTLYREPSDSIDRGLTSLLS